VGAWSKTQLPKFTDGNLVGAVKTSSCAE